MKTRETEWSAVRRSPRRRWIAAALGAAVVTALAGGLLAGSAQEDSKKATSPVAARQFAVNPRGPTSAESSEWEHLTATPESRARLISEVQEAFAGVATVRTDAPVQNTGTITSATSTSKGHAVQALATGVTGDHFWIIASYGDIARGAIAGAVRACTAKVPAWLCTNAGNLLTSWSRGWGAAANHGIWAAVYWRPAHVTGGRW
ncbi:hypothetical protein OH768_32595 [Streptomyces sp. NBC_01622]|uniref:hypothetical protein n=1 Tax=Streptomyces sp. NBC_01622 TaxID=2975903 RepID=UPI0038664E8B|nr:hypothetical protein OH768_32595 [Streptomyces sp. NBC_01622]